MLQHVSDQAAERAALLVSLSLQALVELPVDGGRHPLRSALEQKACITYKSPCCLVEFDVLVVGQVIV